MGAAVSLYARNRKFETYSVDDRSEGLIHEQGFAKSIFIKFEWFALESFCHKYHITQKDLSVVFKKFLSHEEVYLRHFRVRTDDAKYNFLLKTRLQQEIVDAIIPLIYMKDFPGLEQPHSHQEVTFPRFVIMSCIFCNQTIPDLIRDFLAVLRQKLQLHVTSTMHYYSFEQIVKVLLEDLKKSAARTVIVRCLEELSKNGDIAVLSSIKMGLKYPILFYSLERLRKHFRRMIFGDKFWEGKRKMKLQLSDDLSEFNGYDTHYTDEASATKESSRSVIADAMNVKRTDALFSISDVLQTPVLQIEEVHCTRLKTLFGYELARQLIVDSEIPVDCDAMFIQQAFGICNNDLKMGVSTKLKIAGPILSTKDPSSRLTTAQSTPFNKNSIKIYDEEIGRSFKYDTESGKITWAKTVVSESGEVLDETYE